MIWRDDDISVTTDIGQLQKVDDLFQHYRIPHTIALLAHMIDLNQPLVEFIRSRQMIVQLHGWTHEDLTKSLAAVTELGRAVQTIHDVFQQRPTVLYPPWNRSNAYVEGAAQALGLTVSTAKTSLEQYIRVQGDVEIQTVNFHYWHPSDVELLKTALPIARVVKP